MKNTDLAYVAGIIDGEGSIGIAIHKSPSCKRGYTLELCVQVTSSDDWLCQWLRFGFGGSLNHHLNIHGTPMTHWTIVARKAAEFLRLILPYLMIKKPQAEIAINFQSNKKRGMSKSDADMDTENAQRIALQNMHRRPNGTHKGLTHNLTYQIRKPKEAK